MMTDEDYAAAKALIAAELLRVEVLLEISSVVHDLKAWLNEGEDGHEPPAMTMTTAADTSR